jgi:RNA polymerase sigma factor (sigma-70 family)
MNKNIRVEIKIKNNILYKLILSDNKNVNEFCSKYNFDKNTISRYLSLKIFPKRNNKWTETAIKLSEHFKVLPEDIFNEDFNFIEKNTISLEGNIKYIDYMYSIKIENNDNFHLKEAINKILNTLQGREKKIIEMRYGLNGNNEMTLNEIGEVFGITRARVSQIEAKAMRKLRHSSRSDQLLNFIQEAI